MGNADSDRLPQLEVAHFPKALQQPWERHKHLPLFEILYKGGGMG